MIGDMYALMFHQLLWFLITVLSSNISYPVKSMMFPLFLTIIYLYELQNLADLAINKQCMFENSMHSYTAQILVILLDTFYLIFLSVQLFRFVQTSNGFSKTKINYKLEDEQNSKIVSSIKWKHTNQKDSGNSEERSSH